jgi:hypothetical protein
MLSALYLALSLPLANDDSTEKPTPPPLGDCYLVCDSRGSNCRLRAGWDGYTFLFTSDVISDQDDTDDPFRYDDDGIVVASLGWWKKAFGCGNTYYGMPN